MPTLSTQQITLPKGGLKTNSGMAWHCRRSAGELGHHLGLPPEGGPSGWYNGACGTYPTAARERRCLTACLLVPSQTARVHLQPAVKLSYSLVGSVSPPLPVPPTSPTLDPCFSLENSREYAN